MDTNIIGIRSLFNFPRNAEFKVLKFKRVDFYKGKKDDLNKFKDLDLDSLIFEDCKGLPLEAWDFLTEVKAKRLVVQMIGMYENYT